MDIFGVIGITPRWRAAYNCGPVSYLYYIFIHIILCMMQYY